MQIAIDNRQRKLQLNRTALRQVVEQLAAVAASSRGARVWREVTVILTDDAGITPVNRQVMGHEGSTDVITQRYEPLPGEPDGMVGELLVNVERAWQVGPRRSGWSASQELALYIAHGCDHLNDAEDATAAGYQRMRRRELRWLAGVRIPVLIQAYRKMAARKSTRSKER